MIIPREVNRYRTDLHTVLWQGHAYERIKTSPAALQAAVTVGAAPPALRAYHPSAWSIAGGIKDHKRRKESVRIERTDGAWIHFTVAMTDTGEVLAYDFELVFDQVDEPRTARFVRIDLNPVGHPNELLRERRCHLHPGHDDVQFPWEDPGPMRVLQILVNDLPFIKER